jgi:hypothetical protein
MSRNSISSRDSVSVNNHLKTANNLLQGKGELPQSRIDYNIAKDKACKDGIGTDSCLDFMQNRKALLKALRKKHGEPEPSFFRWLPSFSNGGKKHTLRKKTNKRKTKKAIENKKNG